ncbi:hypothetical protein [Ilumatobacter sp.]|uniref:hypothetical protein n=1 Tax=Ilumatobacter sp. TaxID=1967498 RepID=UPI003B52A33A
MNTTITPALRTPPAEVPLSPPTLPEPTTGRIGATSAQRAAVAHPASPPQPHVPGAHPLPPRVGPVRRTLRSPRCMQYHRLVLGVAVVNLVVLALGAISGRFWTAGGSDLRTISAIAQANLVVAIVPRQPWVVNLVSWLATRPATRPPLRVRWALGKYYHLGGLHVGGAVAGTTWYALFVASLIADRSRGVGDVSLVNVVLSGLVVAVFALMALMALPGRRSRDHDRFESTHRFGGWLALALVWANAVTFATSRRGDATVVEALASSPTIVLLSFTTWCALWPWLLLRRVPVSVERPSSHVAIVRLDHGSPPPVGTTRPISRSPLRGWHHFANVPAEDGREGYRMVVSRAGDWTGDFVDDPPSHVWVRGLPAAGVANVKRLFDRVVFVVTGSGIGPALGHLLADETPAQLVWVTRSPRETYGDALVDEIERAQPDAIVWNSDERGKPDVLRLAHDAYVSSGAEAVICISNKAVTWRVVEGLEQRGIPAFGPIWDS